MAVSTDPNDPNFGLETDQSSPNFGLPAQQVEESPSAGTILKHAGEALVETVKGFIPTTPKAIAEFATPVVTGVENIAKAGHTLYDVAFGGKSVDEAVRENIPESQAFVEAEKTPPYSKERFAAGFGMLGQVGMGGLLFKGVGRPLLKEIVSGEKISPEATPQIPEPPISETVPPITPEQIKGGEISASEITSPESVTQPEVRTRVGEEAPLRQQGETATAREEVVPTEEVAPTVPQPEQPRIISVEDQPLGMPEFVMEGKYGDGTEVRHQIYAPDKATAEATFKRLTSEKGQEPVENLTVREATIEEKGLGEREDLSVPVPKGGEQLPQVGRPEEGVAPTKITAYRGGSPEGSPNVVATDGGYYGEGTYWSESPEVAQDYAKKSGGSFTKQELSFEKPLVLDYTTYDSAVKSKSEATNLGIKLNGWGAFVDSADATAKLKAAGYDGVIVKKANEPSEIVKFSSKTEPPPPTPPPAETAVAPEAPAQKPSKIGKSIETKAVEAKLTEGFSETAGYDPIKIADQAERATTFVRDFPEDARAVVRGDATLPEGLHGTSLITAMEEQLLRKPDAKLAYELANSPLTSATSVAAQELRLMGERVPDSIAAKFKEIRDARREGSKLRGETPESLFKEIGQEIVRQSSKRPTWEAFVREITC